ncbi:hypothetical protein [Streptomyces sp. NPDC059063]|uniref:hypothetical protein n=1 Tax=unclassified Streptomyces TaxID=2593676 RepID=UPI00367AD768
MALHPDPPPSPAPGDAAAQRLAERYREVVAEFRTTGLPPLETSYWLIKPRSLVSGTWDEAKKAAAWLAERLAEYAPRFASAAERDTAYLAMLANSAAERLCRGGDVSHGFYLERPAFLSVSLVCCSQNRTVPVLDCPLRW